MIPPKFTQGDYVSWQIQVAEAADSTVSIFIRGSSNPLDLTGVYDGLGSWDFEITESQSAAFEAGNYQAQLVVFSPKRKTLQTTKIHVCPSFENKSEIETRTVEEIELAALNEAIAQLTSKNVVEYEIGTRRVRYNDLGNLYARQAYLRNRIAKLKNRGTIGGRNVGVRYCG